MAVIKIDDLEVYLTAANDRQVLHINSGKGYEGDSLQLWSKLVEPGRIAIDIGAYTGLFAIVAAMRGAKVYALEPLPANLLRLRINAKQNEVRMTILSAAASEHEGTATLNYNPNVTLTTGASLETDISYHSAAMVVPCITIDSLGLSDVATMKIDVERHEPCVLRGAMQTIERCRPSMLIETLDADMRDQILQILPAYDAATVLDGRNTLFTPK